MYKIINRKKLVATVLADIAGSVLFGIPYLLRRNIKIEAENIRRILVMRTAYVGDAIMTLPVFKPLKKKFPLAKISFLVSRATAPLLENHQYVDEVIAYDPFWFYDTGRKEYEVFMQEFRKREFDLVIEARGDIREFLFLVRPLKARYKVSYGIGGGKYFLTHVVPYGGLKHKVRYHLDMVDYLGGDTGDIEWGLSFSEAENSRVADLLTERGVRTHFCAVHPGSRLPLKRFESGKCAELYDRIIDKYKVPVVVLGSPSEKDVVREITSRMKNNPIVLAGELNIRELAVLIGKADFLLCNDSGPMHIASAMKTPTVAIFGPSKSIETGPYGNLNRVVEIDYPCRFTCDENRCRHFEYWGCMKNISVDDVFSSVEDICREGSLLGV